MSSCISTIFADSGTSTPMRRRHLVSRMSCMISRSKLTYSLPFDGWRMISVACSPALLASIDLVHAMCHSVSNSTIVRAIRLYVFTIFLLSFVVIRFWFAWNLPIGSSIRRISWRDHRMFPETGGALRTCGGACFCFSYSRCTVSRSRP